MSGMARLIRGLSLEQSMPADEKSHSGSMLACGIVSRKLQAFSVYKPLLPPPENKEISF